MEKDLVFLKKTKATRFERVVENGWGDEKIRMLFSLISFYKNVVGPLDGLSFQFERSKFRGVKIVYGHKINIDYEKTAVFSGAVSKFRSIMDRYGLERYVVNVYSVEELIFKLSETTGFDSYDE